MFCTRLRHRFIYALLSTITLAGMWGCRKDVETFRPYPPTLEAIQQMLQQVPSASTQTTFTLGGVVQDIELSTPSGVRLFLTDTEHLFVDTDDNPVPCSTCQTFVVKVTEAIDKSDIIAYGIPTVTIDGELLESGGMVRVDITCDGKELELRSDRKLKIQIPAQNPESDMLVFSGVMQNDTFLGWQNTEQEVFQAIWQVAGNDQSGYELLSPHLGWINSDRFVNEPTTSFCVDLPPNFNSENTVAYVVFKNIRAVAALEIDLANQKFCYDNAPIGFQVRLVTMSKTADGQYWLGNHETEIGSDATVVMNPQQVGEQQMLDFLKSL